jgi:hypothetical protein
MEQKALRRRYGYGIFSDHSLKGIMMNLKALIASTVLLASLGAPALAQTPPPDAAPHVRGQHASNHNIRAIHHRVARIITQLQSDQHDYDGHRVKAIQLLQQADEELKAAVDYEKGHPN